MPTTYVPVSPGIDMSRALGGARLTKKWLREYLRDHPEKDFRNLGLGGSYVNGQDALNMDLTLQVMSNGSTVAMVHYQRVERKPSRSDDEIPVAPAEFWGYQAVVS